MKELLLVISNRLKELYTPSENASIEIYDDGSWLLGYNNNENTLFGGTIEELEIQLNIKL